MQTNPIFYKEIVPLDRNHHAQLCLIQRANYRYASETNSIFLTITEFSRALREYPIVFTENSQNVFPLAILGLRDAENLFLTPDGNWKANYIPAYVRRYPFILSNQPNSNDLTVCIDRAYTNFNSDRQGIPLFENGAESQFLKDSLTFLQDFQSNYELSLKFSNRIKELGILEPMQANVEFNNGIKLSMGGFLVVNRQRLANIAAEQLQELIRDGTLELIYLHLNSLENFGRLVDLLSNRSPNSIINPQSANLMNTQTAGNA